MKRNLTTTLIESLRERISSGQFAPGDKLPSENTLIAEHGVSRTVVREAITRLQAEGLVHTRRGAGSFALTPPAEPHIAASTLVPRSLDERRALMEFRIGFESEAAAKAAATHSIKDLAAMDEALRGFEAVSGNASASMNCDYEFHLAVARATANNYFSHAVQNFGPSMIAMPRRRLEPSGSRSATPWGLVTAEHQAVRDAIASGNPQLAAAAMRIHLANSIYRLESESGYKTVS